ncbi:MAG: aldo/keto reductase [Candidatus Aminicenantes bacterium]|nr:aldo/keto reductase [Candidatus Aminicenantes bacterium]
MNERSMDRREFLKRAAGAAAAVGGLASGGLNAATSPFPAIYDAKSLPTRIFGKTGVAVPRIGVGLGSRWCAVEDPEKAQAVLLSALDHGFYYWDTASSYRNKDISSEERIGRVLETRRKEVFLATKCEARTYDETLKEFEGSLKRLRTSYIDVYQIHLLQSPTDVEIVASERGALKALRRLKEEKAARFIGFTGHLSAEAMTAAARDHDFDSMLIALNHYAERKGDLEKEAIPAAAAKNLGIAVIKVIRPRETVAGITADELIRYALSLELVHAAMLGMDNLEVVRKNAELLRAFVPLPRSEMARIGTILAPFFAGRRLPWMDPSYRDGHYA